MNKQIYQLRVVGLREEEGQIKASTLLRVLDALVTTAERTTRLLATGTGSGKGARPGWLDATVDFTVTGLQRGSTVLFVEAPQLAETAREEFSQRDFWSPRPSLDETALDLAARAINEAQDEHPAGNYFDSSVLAAILKLGRASRNANVSYEMTPRDSARGQFRLDSGACMHVSERLDDIPEPRSFVVAGRLDEIKHGSGRFRLIVNQKSALFGRLHASVDVETLRSLWGKLATINGTVHFKANGEPRLIEAHRISARVGGDVVFEAMPLTETGQERGLFPRRQRQGDSFDPRDLAGTWPGNEPIDDLLAQID